MSHLNPEDVVDVAAAGTAVLRKARTREELQAILVDEGVLETMGGLEVETGMALAFAWQSDPSLVRMLLDGFPPRTQANAKIRFETLSKKFKLQEPEGESGRPSAQADPGVVALLDRAESGAVRNTTNNALRILKHDPRVAGAIRLNLFRECCELAREFNYSTGEWDPSEPYPVRDTDENRLRLWIGDLYGFEPSDSSIHSAILDCGTSQKYHPVRSYLQGLRWDGKDRISRWLQVYCHAADTELYRQYGRKFLISCIARVMEPGCQVDTMLILQGDQGLRKSTAFRILGGPWFSSSHFNVENKDALQGLRGRWLWEVGELSAFSKRDIERIKGFLTDPIDTYRQAYGRNVEDYPRQIVFCGTTNDERPLSDDTGARRFWVVPVPNRVTREELERDRDLLWAEAYQAYLCGEPWWLDGHLEKLQAEDSLHFTREGTLEHLLQNVPAYLSGQILTIPEILTKICRLSVDHPLFNLDKAGRTLKKLGWRPNRANKNVRRYWVPAGVSASSGGSVEVENARAGESLDHLLDDEGRLG